VSPSLTLPAPESVTTRFLVAAMECVSEPFRDILSGTAVARTARELHARSLLTIRPHSAAPEWTTRLGGAIGYLERLERARHHLLVQTRSSPENAPRHAQAARQAARLLAAAANGLVIDVDSNQVVKPSPLEPGRFVLGQEWIGVFITLDETGCIRADTAGLHRFGLPELTVQRVSYGHLLTAANLLRALAFRLFAERGAAAVPAERLLNAGDLLRFWGARPIRAGRFLVALSPAATTCSQCRTALEVSPPSGGEAPGWWNDKPGRALPKLLSAHPDG
jgi:hypothetical protein